MKFFFDTADVDFINKTMDRISPWLGDSCMGITTNPLIWQRINKNSLQEWIDHIPKLREAVYSKEIHIQFPNSMGTESELERFLLLVEGDDIVVKIPPRMDFIDALHTSWVPINITGLSEAGSLMKYQPVADYVSLLWGRLAEVGGDPYKQAEYVLKDGLAGQVIAGALRTPEQVIQSIETGCIPTIGATLWDKMTDADFEKMANTQHKPKHIAFCPPFDSTYTDLSVSFFKQMDEAGKQAYEDLKNWK